MSQPDNELRAAAQAVIEWENEYRTLNNLGKYPPHVFIWLAAALASRAPATTPTVAPRNYCTKCGEEISLLSSFHLCSDCRKVANAQAAAPATTPTLTCEDAIGLVQGAIGDWGSANEEGKLRRKYYTEAMHAVCKNIENYSKGLDLWGMPLNDAQAAAPGGKEPTIHMPMNSGTAPTVVNRNQDYLTDLRHDLQDDEYAFLYLSACAMEGGDTLRLGLRDVKEAWLASHPLQDKPPAAPEVETLAKHWLFAMHCNHEEETDTATCACGWNSNPHSSVGLAAEAWAAHALGAAQDKPTP